MAALGFIACCFLMIPTGQMTTATKYERHDIRDISLVNLIHHHLLLCGYDYICNITKFPELAKPSPINKYKHVGSCPDCYCDDSCVSRGDCCPDVYFTLPPSSCVSVTLLQQKGGIEPKPPSYDLVNSCPDRTRNTEASLCEKQYSITELLTRPPVAANDLPVSFKNKHCAKCNGFFNTTDWILDIDCVLFADFNFLSTYQEIIDLAKDRKCRVRFSPLGVPARVCNLTLSQEEQKKIKLCNTTGAWTKFDHNIERACESSYNLNFRIYKNVFCYMCNPPAHKPNDVIDRCNVTGMWHPYDNGLEDACRQHHASYNTRPFKNIFCYLCNRITSDNNIFYDIVANISENIVDYSPFPYSYEIVSKAFRPEYLRYLYTVTASRFIVSNMSGNLDDIITNKNSSTWDRRNSFIVKRNNFYVNVTNLIYKLFAVRPADQFCSKNIVPLQYGLVHFPICSCSPNCLFTQRILCCHDFSLTYPASCFNSYQEGPEADKAQLKRYLVTDGCWKDAGHITIRQNCESSHPTDIVSYLPLVDDKSNYYYKNFHCFLCNKNVEQVNPTKTIEDFSKKSYSPFTVYMMCSDVLDFSHFVNMMDVLNVGKFIQCIIVMQDKKLPSSKSVLDKKIPRVKCTETSKLIDKCNTTGNWPTWDPDVVWACERIPEDVLPIYRKYKNFYCYLCNPDFVVSNVISTCNVTGLWQKYDINHEKACHLFPRIYSFPVFKNIFCELCNSRSIADILPDVVYAIKAGSPLPDRPDLVLYTPTYRSLFSVAEYDDIFDSLGGDACARNQIYDHHQNLTFYADVLIKPVTKISTKLNHDQDVCRNTTCFPGKVLSNNTCIPLLTVTNNLRYSISLELTGTSVKNNITALDFLLSVEDEIYSHLSDLFQTSEYQLDTFYLLSNFPCSDRSELVHVDTLRLSVYMTIFISGYVPRHLTETSLLDQMSNVWNFSLGNESMSLHVQQTLAALRTPSFIQKASFKETCYIQRFHDITLVPLHSFRSVYISRILLCKQIELEENEYKLNMLTMELSILAIEKTLNFYEYQASIDGKIRVCYEDVEALSEPVHVNITRALSILTLVCTVASLVCLFITFIVYLLCPSLWSIPGVNNMCLVLSLFLTQITFLVGDKAHINFVLCAIVGVVSHFLWLISFGWMTICSFHMFRMFSSSGGYHRMRNKRHTLKNYCTATLGIPFLTVVLNVLFNLGLNEGQTIGYGEHRCFISSKISFVITLLVPIILACLTNIIFFSITAHNIRTTPNVDSNKENRRHFGIYVKLFILTGVTWLITVIEAFFPISVFSYLTTVLNGCQGVFIFVSYVLNKRVFTLLSERHSKAVVSGSRPGSSSQQTGTSSLALKISSTSDSNT